MNAAPPTLEDRLRILNGTDEAPPAEERTRTSRPDAAQCGSSSSNDQAPAAVVDPPRLRRWSAAEMDTADLTVRWLVRGLLTTPTYGMVAGQMKTLKTHLTVLLAVSIASGKPFLGQFDIEQPGPVMIYVGEGGRIPYTRLLRRACQTIGVTLADLPLHVVFDVAPVTSDLFRQSLAADLTEIRPALVLIDPWYAFHGAGTDAKNLFEEGALLSGLQTQVAGGGANLLLVNHFNQTGTGGDLKRITMVGGGEWVDSWLLLTHRTDPDVDRGEFRLGLQIGSRQWGGSTWELDVHTGVFDADLGHHDGDLSWDLRRAGAAGGDRDVVTQRILEAAEHGAAKEDLARAAGISLSKARQHIESMVDKALLDVRRVVVQRSHGRPLTTWHYFDAQTKVETKVATLVPALDEPDEGCPPG